MRWEYCWSNAYAWYIKPEWFGTGVSNPDMPQGLEALRPLAGTRVWCLWADASGWVQLANALDWYGSEGWELTSMGPG